MKTISLLALAAAMAMVFPGCATRSTSKNGVEVKNAPAPPAELKFSEFFASPVGPYGLAVTEKLTKLDGRRVRIVGYMVQQEHPPRGQFILSPRPGQIHHHDNHLAEDLPPSLLYVSVPTCKEQEVPFVPGLLLLTGTLSVGQQREMDERISMVRLSLDPPAKKTKTKNTKPNSTHEH